MKLYVVAILDNIQPDREAESTMTDDEIDSVLSQWIDDKGAVLLEVDITGRPGQRRSSIRIVPTSEA